MKAFALPALLVALACAAEPPAETGADVAPAAAPTPPAELGGEPVRLYRSRIDLAAFDARTEIELSLSLLDNGRFNLDAVVTEGSAVDVESASGVWTLADDRLTLVDGEDGDIQTFRVRGEEIVMETGWEGDVVHALGLPRLSFRRVE